MQHLKMGSLNIHGGRDANKRALVSEIVGQKSIDVGRPRAGDRGGSTLMSSAKFFVKNHLLAPHI